MNEIPNGSCKSPCVPEGGVSSTFRFEDLVFDIQIQIIAFFVPAQDLVSLTLVSRYINSLATPALYSDIRLLFGLKPPRGSFTAEGAFTETLISAQRTFVGQLLVHRERASQVRSLAWQVYVRSGPAFTDLFPLMDNVTRVHLVDPHPTHLQELKLVIPPLFPRVKDVKFTGTTSLSYVMPILHSPHRLASLSLETVHPQSVALRLLEWVSNTDLPCLHTLSLRALAQTQSAQSWDVTKEDELLLLWRKALAAVRSTLEDVTLGFRAQHQAISKDTSPPSADRFMQSVIPVFWEEEWPRLQTVQLEGIDLDSVGTYGYAARLRGAVAEVMVDPTVHCVQRIWHSQSTDRF